MIIFKVAEAETKDVGRAIVRIDPKDFSKVKGEVGEFVEIRGSNEKARAKTVAKLMPCFEAMRGKGILQMDGILRDNTKVGLGEKVIIKKVQLNQATAIVLKPLISETSFKQEDSEYFAQILDGTPVIKGNKIRVNFFGTKFQDFEILDTDPAGVVLITSETLVKIKGAGKITKKGIGVTYEDIGGLKKEIGKIREMIELPLKYPEVFERLGIDAPKGVLLYGPPGCGKTLIAKAVANETDAYFTSISGPEIMGKFYGESEGRLREVFEEAQANIPAILVIDEIDAIAPKREDMGGEKQVERRVVAQLLALMDGLEARGDLVVIGISVASDTPIFVKDKGLMKIAEFVDPYYEENEEGERSVDGLEVLGYDPQGNDPRSEARRFVSAKFQSVKAVFRHKVDEIYEIEYAGRHHIRVTAGHSIFIRVPGGIKPIKASDLRPGDMLVGLPYSTYNHGRKFSKAVVFESEIPEVPGCSLLDEETAYLLGLWLAEGYIGDKKRIDFCFSKKEKELRERVKAWARKLQRKPYNHPTISGGAVNMGFVYAELARFITKNFGGGAKNKYLPAWVFTLPQHLFFALLSGWMAGDGCKAKDGRIQGVTISPKLAIGMLWACRMHNLWPSLQTFHYSGFGEGIAYCLKFSRANNPWNSFQEKRRAKRVQPGVKSIKRLPFNGYVYDLCGCAGEAFYGGEMPVLLHNTNIPNTLDPALRRPGRFDREISIPIPDKNERKEILEIHTRGMPLAKTVDLEKLAEITHGFVGADLEALAREAAMSALRKVLPEIEFAKEYIPYKKLLGLEVTIDHFREALKEVEPSALREVFTEIPNVRWEDVGGLEDIKQTLKETIEWPLNYGELFDHSKTKPSRGILLYGSPGTGKTLIAKAVATEAGVNFISVKGPQLLAKYIGESERAVREVFKKAKQASPCIIFFDELDSLVPVRGQTNDSQVTARVVSQFLTELDGIEELKGVVILGATNRLDLIDPAMLRAGRFDFLLEVPLPCEKTRREIFRIHTKGKPLASDVELNSLAKGAEGLTGSDIEAICRRASLLAIREFLVQESKTKKVADLKITAKHFQKAMT